MTQILTLCGLRAWPTFLKKEERDWYLARGAAIHRATELLDRGRLDWATVDLRIVPYIEAWKKFRAEIGGKLVAIELEVNAKKYGYIGHLDRVLGPSALCRTPVVLDIKTTEADVATRLQTSGYLLAYGKKARRGYVALHDDGTYRAEVYDDDAADREAWLACVRLAAWMVRKNNGRKPTGKEA